MPDETTGTETPAQEDFVQDNSESLNDVAAFVEGFGNDDDGAVIPADDPGDNEGNDTDDQASDSDSNQTQAPDPKEDRIKALEAHVNNLNAALHQARQAKKNTAKKGPEISRSQLKQLFQEHQDDPETLFNLMTYMVDNGAKETQQKAVDAAELAQKKRQHDEYVNKAWPELSKPGSPLRGQVDTVKENMGIGDHFMGDYLAMGAMIIEQLPAIQKAAYEKGQKEAGKVSPDEPNQADNARKKAIKTNKLLSGGTGSTGKKGHKLSADQLATAKRMGMTPSQLKIYQSLINKGN